MRARVPEVQLPRNQPPLHRQHRLDQAGNSGSRLQMPDVGLHRADQQGAVLFASPAVHRRGGLHLDRVPQRGPGPVCLQVVHLGGRNSRPRQRLLDHPLLRRTVRHGRACGRPVLVDGRSADQPPDAVAGRLGIPQPSEDDHPAAFAPHEAIRRGIKGLAPTLGRQHPQLRHLPSQPGGQDRVHPSNQGEVHFALPQSRHRLMYGDQ